jgi:adenylate cyclase
MDEIFAEGYRDVLICPLTFLSGESHAISFATHAEGGFTDTQITALHAIIPALSRIAEILALRRTAANLLSTYVGRNAGHRILAGNIQRGDVESLRAVIWFSDLRGFTTLAGELAPTDVVRALNELFECQVPHIEHAGGEVLKFMGDGLFAIFPIEAGGREASAICDAALDMASRAFEALGVVNEVRAARGARPLAFGLALHVGDVAYGNIGGSSRLDFTCIGPAVNVAARLEGLASKLGRRLVLSDAFQALTTRPTEPLGEFELKGVAGPQRVHVVRP